MTIPTEQSTTAIREEAAAWVVQLCSSHVSAADKIAFASWLRTSPLHVNEYLRAEATWRLIAIPPQTADAETPAPIEGIPENVVPFDKNTIGSASRGVGRADSRGSDSSTRRLASFGAIAAALSAVAILLGSSVYSYLDSETFVAGVGEQRRILLEDGSVVTLNTRSKVRVRMTRNEREIILTEGEGYFEVASDPKRPFRVISEGAVVEAVGTEFNVYRHTGETVLAVVEGRVAVQMEPQRLRPLAMVRHESTPTAARIEVGAGEALEIKTGAATSLPGGVSGAVAWRQRRLIFDNAPLTDVVAQFNRYNQVELVIDDPELANHIIGGVFDVNKPGALVQYLILTEGVGVAEVQKPHRLLLRKIK